MANLVHRDYEPEFIPKIGTTVTVRKPTTFTAADFDRNAGISIQNATETSVAIVLNKHKDVSFAVTDEDLTLRVEDFNTQFIRPAMEALVQAIDQDILTLKNDIVQEVGTNGSTPTASSTTATSRSPSGSSSSGRRRRPSGSATTCSPRPTSAATPWASATPASAPRCTGSTPTCPRT